MAPKDVCGRRRKRACSRLFSSAFLITSSVLGWKVYEESQMGTRPLPQGAFSLETVQLCKPPTATQYDPSWMGRLRGGARSDLGGMGAGRTLPSSVRWFG